MSIRELYGMRYKAAEMEHAVSLPMSSVLRKLADWVEENEVHGYLSSVSTQSHPDDEDKFLTHLLWADH